MLNVLVGVMVLVAVALTARAVDVRLNRPTLVGAGFVSGIAGTATSIGGPPLAIVYQREESDVLRSTLGVYFMVGGTPKADLDAAAAGKLALGGHHSPLFKVAPAPSVRVGVEASVLALLDLLKK